MIRRLEIIGEAVNRLSEETKATNNKIYWQGIVGLRNRLIHKYPGIDSIRLWDTIKSELPILKNSLIWSLYLLFHPQTLKLNNHTLSLTSRFIFSRFILRNLA